MPSASPDPVLRRCLAARRAGGPTHRHRARPSRRRSAAAVARNLSPRQQPQPEGAENAGTRRAATRGYLPMTRGWRSMPRRRRSRSELPRQRACMAPATTCSFVAVRGERSGSAISCIAIVAPPELRATCSPAIQQRHRVAAFDDARQAKPGRERQRPHRSRRHIGQIEHDQTEPASLQDEVHGLQRARCIAGFANPQQVRQIEP